MKYTTLPISDIKISKICLSSMTFGNKNTEANSQLDYALERGLNFIDSAEMYPIGRNVQIFGSTERFIGTWIHKIGQTEREKLVIATKIVGMKKLKDNLSKALNEFEGKGLTVEQRNGKVYVSMENKLLFESGSWTVGSVGKKAVVALGKVLGENPEISVLIEGHSDNDKF